MRSSHLTDGVVLLRPPTVDDVDAITRACQDPEIAAWVSTPYPYQRSHAVWFVQTIVQPGWQSGTDLVWAVRDAATDLLLGMVGLHRIADGSGEIGFWMAPWGRGAGGGTRAVARARGLAGDPDGLALVRVGGVGGHQIDRPGGS